MAAYGLNEAEMDKYCSIITKNSTACKCTHKIPIPPKLDRVICSWCGHWVYRTPELEEKYKEQEKRLKFKRKLSSMLKK